MNLEKKKICKILIINYFSTKLYIYNIINTINICRNTELLKKRKTRLLPYFYSNLNFIIKYNSWNYIFKKIYLILLNSKKYKYNFIKFLTLKSIDTKISNIQYRKMEFSLNFNIYE